MNNEIRAAIRPVKARVEDELIARPGVNAVDIAEKVTGGQPTGEMSIVVYVDKKQPPSRLSKGAAIPAEIDGVKTDVQEMTIELQSPRWEPLDVSAQVDATAYPTLVGGISMGPSRSFYLTPPEVPTAGNYVMVGTLGALVKDNATGATMALSNFHVAAVDTTWSTSDRQCQPGRVDGGSPPGDEFGTLARAVISEHVDGSVTTLDSGKQWKAQVQGIGDVAGTAAAVLNQAVRKRGRTTELTYGSIASLDFTVSIDYGDGVGTKVLKNQLRIATDTTKSVRFSDHGDSGSVIMTDDRHVVGLLFAGSSDGANTFANPIDAVLSELNVTLLTGGLSLVTRTVICKPSLLTICPSQTVFNCWSKTILCKPSVITICLTQQVVCRTSPILCNNITQTPICVVSGPVCGGPPGGPVEGPIEQPGFQGGEQVDYGYGEADVYSAGYAGGYSAAAEATAPAAQGVGDQLIPNLSYVVCPSQVCPSFTICPSRVCPSVLYCPSLACPSRFCPSLVACPSRVCPSLACPSLACPSLACTTAVNPGQNGPIQAGGMDASFWAGYLAALEQQGEQGLQ